MGQHRTSARRRRRRGLATSALLAAMALTFAMSYLAGLASTEPVTGATPRPLERADRGAAVSGLAPLPALPTLAGG